MENRTKALRLAVPSDNLDGLEAQRSDHFRHCDIFTIINIRDNGIVGVQEVANHNLEPGGCMAPVTWLRDQGVEAIVVGGIGARPLQGFTEAGISVYYADRNDVLTVQDVAKGMLAGYFALIQQNKTCRNHGDCH